ncbi:MAG: efflux RND transporter periplasmic adaptor subunit [Pseudorhodoplanes sp.]|nr:MAG: efflux RND transporter periplasmic adaptor subunit [Pseudorhodoplanes sp.]
MTKRTWLWVAGAAVAVVAAIALTRFYWTSNNAAAQNAQARRAVPVEIAVAERRRVPVRIEALGNVVPIASVAVKPRLDTVITEVHFADGARVREGDLLFTLDSRQIEAEIRRVEAVIAGALAQLEQAERDVQRYTELVSKNATTVVTLNNAQTQVNIARATAESNKATLENLKVQLDYARIRAPITGRISAASVKVGNFVRPADTAPLAIINQMAPVYVSFTVPQRLLPDVRHALGAETATVEAIVPGEAQRAPGVVTMIDNTVDSTTGMVAIRASMPNGEEILWPGALVRIELTTRIDDAVTVPSSAVQVSQNGTFVFLVKDGAAVVQRIRVDRVVGDISVVSEGLAGGETVVTDGQLLLSNGTRVAPRGKSAGS